MNRLTVLNPKAAPKIDIFPGAPRPAGLKGATIGFVDNSKLNADRFIERLQPLLRDDYGIKLGAKVRKFAPKDELSNVELADLAKCAAVVQCYGD